jgi:hypothetical protein
MRASMQGPDSPAGSGSSTATDSRARLAQQQQQQLALRQQQARAAEKALNMPTPPAATPVSEDGAKPAPAPAGVLPCF